MTPDEKRDYYSREGRSLPAGTRFSTYHSFPNPLAEDIGFEALDPMCWDDSLECWRSARVLHRPTRVIDRCETQAEWVDWNSVPDPPNAGCPDPGTTVQKYHHGPCNEHCRCGREAAAATCADCGKPAHPLNEGGLCDSCYVPPPPDKCGCGAALHTNKRFGVREDHCGECWLARRLEQNLDKEHAPQRPAARAVTDEAEGAWSTATSEGP